MRAVLTRVKHASVTIDGKVHGQIGEGFLILLGVTHEDTEAQAVKLADKLTGLRIFEDENGKMNRSLEDEVEKAIMAFVTHYGLLGLMTALPNTPSFMDYEAVYLPKNHFIKEESMATEDYLALFYPFDKLDVVKKGVESSWNVSGDNMMIALTMTFMDEPMAKNMSFQREYAEPYDWVAQQFKDWAFTLTTSIL